jgi:hypothetical protein
MIQVFHCLQGSEEWFRCRLGIPTASEFKSILARGEGRTRRTYMLKLAGERLTGEPAEAFTNAHTERGRVLEGEARHLYAFLHDVELQDAGFVRNGDIGCSPDSLIGDAGVLEIKTKLPHLQIELLVADELPPEHKAQVQGHLLVCEREFVDFASYWPKIPLFKKRIGRDEPYLRMLKSEINRFNDELDALTEKLVRAGATRVAA